MKKAIDVLDTILTVFSMILAAVMAGSVILSVLMRYILGISFPWFEEVITMLFISTTFFGGALAFEKREHISISSLLDLLPAKIQTFLDCLCMVIVGAVQVCVLKASIAWIQQVGLTLTAGLRVKIGFFYTMIPISASLILIYILCKFIILICKRRPIEQVE